MAACSPEEAQNKALAFAQAMQDKAQKDPSNYATIMRISSPDFLNSSRSRIWKLCASSMMKRLKN